MMKEKKRYHTKLVEELAKHIYQSSSKREGRLRLTVRQSILVSKNLIDAIMTAIAASLAKDKTITVTGLGTFRLVKTKPRYGKKTIPAGEAVKFTPSRKLKRLIKQYQQKEKIMEERDKYAVVQDKTMDKVGENKTINTCPKFGAVLTTSNVPHCPNCGTEPFEGRNEDGS